MGKKRCTYSTLMNNLEVVETGERLALPSPTRRALLHNVACVEQHGHGDVRPAVTVVDQARRHRYGPHPGPAAPKLAPIAQSSVGCAWLMAVSLLYRGFCLVVLAPPVTENNDLALLGLAS